jgi:hypothetical protein
MMTGYIDESANSRTVLVGGWIANDQHWELVAKLWTARIEFENRICARKGLPILSRYHAAECASRTGEFAGWTLGRQVRLVKKLQDILMVGLPRGVRSYRKPMAFGWGASTAEAGRLPLGLSARQLRRYCYGLCVWESLKEIARIMQQYYTGEEIRFIHDQGGLYSTAKGAFDELIAQHETPKRYFVGFEPGDARTVVPLQAADMIAYDLFRQIDKRLLGEEDVRRSLKRIVGNNAPIIAGCFAPQFFGDFYEHYKKELDNGQDE